MSGQGRNNSSNSTPNRVTSSSNSPTSSNSGSNSSKNNSGSSSSSSNNNKKNTPYGTNWSANIDYGKLMLVAKDDNDFWRLAKYRTDKAYAMGITLGSAGVPSNQELYERWKKSKGYTSSAKPSGGKNQNNVARYATGIEEGPVTYTGLAMLHGTPSKPEYVLNSDQAYNLLRNMATTRLPEMERTGTDNNCGTQYIVQGDVVLEGVNDPAKFWSGVTTAMGSRWNVTRKTRG